MNRNILLKIGGFLILALAMLSCTNTNLSPVFYAIEHEKSLVDDRGFPDDAVVQRIIQNGAGNYFAAAGTLYTRAPGGGAWSPISAPVAGALCTNVEIFGTNLVAAYLAPGNNGLYYRDVGLGDSWTLVTSLPANAQIGLIRNINSNLFVSTLSGDTYGLYYSNALTTAFTATNVTASDSGGTGPISDIVWDNANTTYWVSVGSALKSGTVLPNGFASYAGADNPTTGRAFGGLFISSSGTLYLGADGKFYTRPTAGPWAAHPVPAVGDNSVQFTTFVEIPAPPLATADVYAGTGGYGYYVTSSLVRSPSYTISALFDGAILSMLYDGSGATPVLLLGTYNSGLWRGDWDGANWQWKQE